MISAWLDPSLLFISGDDWGDEEKRDDFLNNTQEHLNVINEVGQINILWSDEMNCRLWEEPKMPPWRIESDWSNVLVPIIYNSLMQHVTIVDLDDIEPALSHPEMACSCNISLSLSLRIISYMLLNDNQNYHVCLGCENSTHRPYKFLYGESEKQYSEVSKPHDWFNGFEIHDLIWPTSKVDTKVLHCAVQIARKK